MAVFGSSHPDANIVRPPCRLHKQHLVTLGNGNVLHPCLPLVRIPGMFLQNCFYLLDSLRVLLLKDLISDGSREHMAGYVPGRSGRRDKGESNEKRIVDLRIGITVYAISDARGARKSSGQPTINSSKQAGMARNPIIVLLIGLTLASVHLAEGQQPTKVSRIGYLTGTTPDGQLDRIEAFRQGLRELGYVEGKNIVIEWRSAEGKLDRLPARAAELVRLKVDIIVTAGPLATRAAKEATNTIPIVISQDPDPVGNGFVASLARPGGNITGLSSLTADLSGKRLELLKEIIPKLSRVAVFGTSTGSTVQQRREIELAAGAFKVQLQYRDVLDPKDIETAFREASKARPDAVLVVPSSVLISHRKQVVELAVKSRLPAIYSTSQYVVAGGLMSYGVNTADVDRRAATYVDKILERHQARRSPGGAADEVRVYHQP